MRAKEWDTVDKSGWGSGPWVDEPDKIQWPDEETGLPCLMVRNDWSGSWCGYVGVHEQHRLFEMEYMEFEGALEVHGGVTFTSKCSPDANVSTGICHLVDKGESSDVWWIGFDCGHSGDKMPSAKCLSSGLVNGIYRDRAYVEENCRYLASQLRIG